MFGTGVFMLLPNGDHKLMKIYGMTEKCNVAKLQEILNALCRIKRPARDACLCMGELPAPPATPAPAAPHFVFLITL